MTDSDDDSQYSVTRRTVLAAAGLAGAGTGLASLSSDGQGNLSGGTMALEEAYKIAEAERASYVGPDSAKGTITPNDGDRYEAVDTNVVYHGDGGSWQGPKGIGSSSKAVPAVSTDEALIDQTTRQSAVQSTDLTPTDLANRPYMMDDPHSRVWNKDGSQYSDDYGDTWSSSGGSVPTGTNDQGIIFATQNYLFAATWEPLEIHRASYSTSGGFSWTKVLSCQANSRLINTSGRHGLMGRNPNTGTLIVGEYTTASNSNFDPRLYRSTDEGGTWSQVAQFTLRHVHTVGHDPYNDGHWIACIGDSGENQRYAESTDDGKTWTRTEFGPYDGSQAVGFDFGPDYIYFSEDKSEFFVGPWAYDRETGTTHLLCSEHPKQTFSERMYEMIQYSLVHDAETGVTYFDVREKASNREWSEVVAYVRYIGDKPQLLDSPNRARLRVLDGHLFNAADFGLDRRYDLLNRGGS